VRQRFRANHFAFARIAREDGEYVVKERIPNDVRMLSNWEQAFDGLYALRCATCHECGGTAAAAQRGG